MQSQMLVNRCFMLFGFIALVTFGSGCSSQGRSMGLGGSIGAGSGAILGGIADPGKKGEFRTRNIVIGAALGGLAGTVAGAAIHNNTEREKELAYLKGRDSRGKSGSSGTMPALQQPEVEAKWVDGKIVGNRYIDGHYEYVITQPARWEASND